jgi:hypothetical protein
MERHRYDEYLARFNARDYRGVLEFYAPRFEVRFAGVTLRGPQHLLDFYGFLHQYLAETITIHYRLEGGRFVEAVCAVVDPA